MRLTIAWLSSCTSFTSFPRPLAGLAICTSTTLPRHSGCCIKSCSNAKSFKLIPLKISISSTPSNRSRFRSQNCLRSSVTFTPVSGRLRTDCNCSKWTPTGSILIVTVRP
uniref:Uncharacterized protein n=1 Tax=Arundo donax TaxID=35708 RepID=A0A0A9CWL9_ARUDO